MPKTSAAHASSTAPGDMESLRHLITSEFASLSKRLQEIARFALDNPSTMALETVASIAKQAGVQPSAMIRFANALGYSGFSEMQRVFQTELLERVPSYNERMRKALDLDSGASPRDTVELLREFCNANVASLRHLGDVVAAADLEAALDLLESARIIHLLGLRRSFPVASYLAYALSKAECKAHLLSGVAGLLNEQCALVDKDGLMVAISATPYAAETVAAVEAAAERGIQILAITDSPLSPLARHSTLTLLAQEAELRGFRSLTATLCLAQTLVVGLTLRKVRRR